MHKHVSLFKAEAKNVEATFRVNGAQPEFWDADKGTIVKPAQWRTNIEANGTKTTTVSFDLEPSGSIFVVFPKSTNDKVTSPVKMISPQTGIKVVVENDQVKAHVFENGNYHIKLEDGTQQLMVNNVPSVQTINSEWQLSFPKQFSYREHLPKTHMLKQLISWPDHSDKNVQHFSGTGVYTTHFKIEELVKHQKTILDLGEVQVIAEVKLNGVELATLWKPPYQVDVSNVLKAGDNKLEVRVTNLWINRMIGDAAYPDLFERTAMGGSKGFPKWLLKGEPVPETERTTFSTYHPYQVGDPLQSSGLIGPVTLSPYIERVLK